MFSKYVRPRPLCSHFELRAKTILRILQKLQGTLVVDSLTRSAVLFKPKL
jgi:hypothetical protein